MTKRDEILRATSEAARVLAQFDPGHRTSFDIVGTVLSLEIPLLFRPLKGLWGAAITVGDELQGVVVTTKLGLHVQRFTLAHELGHILLGHKTSFDREVGFLGRFGPSSRPVQELAADVFASELLAPKSLVLAAARRHRWNRDALLNAGNVYQLSLRLGVSFEAACWAAVGHRIFTSDVARVHLSTPVKELKQDVADSVDISNPWADVWKLSQADTGTLLEAGPEDLFALQLEEDVSAGFIWELIDSGAGSQVVAEHRDAGLLYGESAARVVFLRFPTAGLHRLILEHRRPWNKQTISHIDISIATDGKEQGGFAKRVRETAIAAYGA